MYILNLITVFIAFTTDMLIERNYGDIMILYQISKVLSVQNSKARQPSLSMKYFSRFLHISVFSVDVLHFSIITEGNY